MRKVKLFKLALAIDQEGHQAHICEKGYKICRYGEKIKSGLGMQHQVIIPFKVCSNGDLWMAMTYFLAM